MKKDDGVEIIKTLNKDLFNIGLIHIGLKLNKNQLEEYQLGISIEINSNETNIIQLIQEHIISLNKELIFPNDFSISFSAGSRFASGQFSNNDLAPFALGNGSANIFFELDTHPDSKYILSCRHIADDPISIMEQTTSFRRVLGTNGLTAKIIELYDYNTISDYGIYCISQPFITEDIDFIDLSIGEVINGGRVFQNGRKSNNEGEVLLTDVTATIDNQVLEDLFVTSHIGVPGDSGSPIFSLENEFLGLVIGIGLESPDSIDPTQPINQLTESINYCNDINKAIKCIQENILLNEFKTIIEL